MTQLRQCRVVADLAVEIRVLHDDAGCVGIDQLGEVLTAARRRVLHLQLVAGEPRIGFAHRAVMRMQPARQHGLVAPCDPPRHRDRFGTGGGAVIHRRVGDLHAGQQRHLRLELEQVLQCPLRQLRLIRGIGRQEFAALDQMVNGRRHVVTIDPAAEKERHRTGDGVLPGHRGEAALDLEFAHRTR